MVLRKQYYIDKYMILKARKNLYIHHGEGEDNYIPENHYKRITLGF